MDNHKEIQRKWNKNNREKIKEYTKKYMKGWRNINKERLKEYQHNWIKNNPKVYKKYIEDKRKRRIEFKTNPFRLLDKLIKKNRLTIEYSSEGILFLHLDRVCKRKDTNSKSLEHKEKVAATLRNYYKNHPEVKERYRQLRYNQVLPVKDTTIEVKIQNFLKQLNIEFYTHQYIKEIEHGYQCDILIPSIKLVIECDGNYWHKYPIGNDIDHIRTSELINKGFKVLRLWEKDIRIMDLNKFKELLL